MVIKRKLNWGDDAKRSLKTIIKYIRTNSPQNAEKVKKDIKESIRELIDKPERHPKDKYRSDNDISYRAFELHKIRISYFISADEVRIVRIRHTSQEPLLY
jgi:plasmid stabilization system protein ParE